MRRRGAGGHGRPWEATARTQISRDRAERPLRMRTAGVLLCRSLMQALMQKQTPQRLKVTAAAIRRHDEHELRQAQYETREGWSDTDL